MTSSTRTFQLCLALALVALLALLAVGCGGGSSSSSSSTTETTTTAAGTSSSFADCLKKNGVEGFDPSAVAQGGPPQNVDPAALQKAMQACRSLAPQGQGFGGQGQNGQSGAQREKLQACLKKQGVDGFTPGAGQSTADRDKLQKAMQACGAGNFPGGAGPSGGAAGGAGGAGPFAAFSRCMKRHGVTLPGAGSGTPTSTTSARYALAQKACQKLLGNPSSGANQ